MSRFAPKPQFDPIHEYFHPSDQESMGKRDAEIAMAMQIFNENPESGGHGDEPCVGSIPSLSAI